MTSPNLQLEMTFRHLTDLESLVGAVRRCATILERHAIEGARCSVYVAPRAPGGSMYEAETRLTACGVFAIERAAAPCPYEAIEQVFERLGGRLAPNPQPGAAA